MAPWSAPAKAILFGEHAVVYGEPALAVALDRRVAVDLSPARQFTVNGRPMTDRHHGYIKKAVEIAWEGGPLRIVTASDIPSAAGMGSSAAITVASAAAVLAGGADRFDAARCAAVAHRAECLEEGRAASPLDTSTCTLGSGVLVSREEGEGLVWKLDPPAHCSGAVGKKDGAVVNEGGSELNGGDAAPGAGGAPANGEGAGDAPPAEDAGAPWYVHHFRAPSMSVVLGHTGLKARTRAQVEKVSHFASRQKGFARDIMAEIGGITRDGARALERGDHTQLGELMDRNDNLLGILGVSSKELSKLVDAARRHSYGAKMIGSGGGGCMMALTDRPERTAEAISRIGGDPYILSVASEGVKEVEGTIRPGDDRQRGMGRGAHRLALVRPHSAGRV